MRSLRKFRVNPYRRTPQKKLRWVQFALTPITSSGIGQPPNQRLAVPLRGPSLKVARPITTVHVTSNPPGRVFFYRGTSRVCGIVVLSTFLVFLSSRKTRLIRWDSNPCLPCFVTCQAAVADVCLCAGPTTRSSLPRLGGVLGLRRITVHTCCTIVCAYCRTAGSVGFMDTRGSKGDTPWRRRSGYSAPRPLCSTRCPGPTGRPDCGFVVSCLSGRRGTGDNGVHGLAWLARLARFSTTACSFVVGSCGDCCVCELNVPFRAAAPFWGQTPVRLKLSSPKRDCSPTRGFIPQHKYLDGVFE